MAEDQLSLIADPYATPDAPRPFEIGKPTAPPKPTSLIASEHEARRLEDAARRAPTMAPDQAARILAMQRKTGLPLEIVQRNLETVEQQTAAADFDVEKFRAESPLLAQWLAAHPANMALAQDDLPPLTAMEKTLRLGRNLAGAIPAGLLSSVGVGGWGGLREVAEVTEPTAMPASMTRPAFAAHLGVLPISDVSAQFLTRAAAGTPDPNLLAPGNIDLFRQPKVVNPDGSISTVDSLSVNLDGQEVLLPTVTPDGRHFTGTAQQVTEQAIDEYRKTGRHLGIFRTPEAASAYAERLHEGYAAGAYEPITTANRELAEYATGAALVAQTLTDKLRGDRRDAGFLEQSAYSGLESIGGMLPGIVFGPIAGASAAAGLEGAAALTAATQAATLTSLGLIGATTTGQAYQEAREQGVGVGTAAGFSAFQGAVEVATEWIPAERLFASTFKKLPLVQTIVHQIAPEIATENVATILQDAAEWAVLPANHDKTVWDYLKERPSQAALTTVSTLVAVGGMSVAAHGTARVLERLGVDAQASKTIGRAPDQVRDFLNAATRDSAIATVGLPIDTFTSYFQAKRIDPAHMAEQLTGDRHAYQRAVDSGADLAVPMGAYVTEIASHPEHSAFFANEARLAPQALNVRETQALEQHVAGELEAATAAPAPTTAGQVREAMRAQLEQAGFPARTSRVYADIGEAVFSTLGARAGVDPFALYSRYGLQVRREGLRPETTAGPQVPHGAGEAIVSDIPASERRPGETPAQRTQRERAHWAQLLATVLREARQVDPTVDERVVRRAFAERRERFEYTESLGRESGQHPQTLLEAIADAGGLWWEKRTEAYRGEINILKESSTAPDVWGGVKGVFRREGLSPDRMVEALRQDPRFAHLTDINALLDAVDDAVRHPSEADRLPGTADLAKTLGIRTGTAWWREGEGLPAEPDAETRLYQGARDARRAHLEERIQQARAQGREDLRALRELQDLRDDEGRPFTVADVLPPAAVDARGDPTSPDFYRSDDRGIIRFGKDRQFQIELFASADLSTFLHESAHFYLEVLGDVVDELAAQDPTTLTDTQRQLLSDYGAVLQWFGVENRGDIGTAQHEQFARAFEAYLMEGQAPNPELRSVFARVRAWLVSIYRTVRRLNAEVSPALRAVFDRLLATDDAIAVAQADTRGHSMFSDALAEAAGLSPADREALRATTQAATDRAREALQAKLLEQLQRERTGWWQEERASVRGPIARDLAAQPIYRALALLQRGTLPDGSPLPTGTEPFKLHHGDLVEQFGEGVLERLPRGVTARDGVPPAVAAELLGFRSSQELVRLLVNAPPLEAAIDAAADEEMKRRHGDMLLDNTIGEHARQAVLEAGADVFAADLKALQAAATRSPGRPGAPVASVSTIRAIAERRIGDTAIRDIRPSVFAAAARRAGDQAAEAAGRQDFTAALAAKQRQVLNAELYRAAVAAREAVDAAIDGFHPILAGRDPRLAARYDLNLVNAARQLLSQFHLAPPALGAAAATYLDQVRKYDAELHANLEAAIEAAAQPSQPYREMTYDQFIALRDAVDGLWHLARRSKQMVIEGKAHDLDEVKGTLEARLQAIDTPTERRGYARALTAWEKTKLHLMGWRAALRRVESWVDAVDGGDPLGSFHRLLFNPISEAGSRYRIAKQQHLAKYLAIVKAVEGTLSTAPIAAPELASFAAPEGYTFNGTIELLHALLHTGNESNLSKLLRGRYWGEETADGGVDTSRWDAFLRRLWREGTLRKEHYDYVQGVWDLLESLKPEAQRVHQDLLGYYFAEITAQPVQTPFGEYRGGYMPAIVDPEIADDAAIRADRDALEETSTSFMFPTTGRGFTKGRIEGYAKPLKLDLRVVPAHLDKVLRFIHLEPSVKDAARLVNHRGFRRSLNAFDPTVASEMLVPWLQRAAKQTIDTPNQGWGGRGADRFWRAVRRRTGLSIMAFNVVNAVQQLTGLSVAALKVPPVALSRALFRYLRQPFATTQAVGEKSAFMQTRTGTQAFEVQQHIDDLLLNPSAYERVREFAIKHGYFLQSAMQNLVDVITWTGAYDTAIEKGATELDAVRQADSAVRLTQGSFNPEDVSKYETSDPRMRAFTMFYSYWNMLANTLGSEFAITIRDVGLKAGAGRLLYVYTFGFLAPAILSELIAGAARGELPSDDDDDGVLDEYLRWFFGVQGRGAAAMVPGIPGQAALYAGRWYFGEHAVNDRIALSPAVTAIERAVLSPYSVYQATLEDGRKKTAITDTLTAIGLLTGLAVAPIGKPLGYLTDIAEERVEPAGPVDLARGLVVGR